MTGKQQADIHEVQETYLACDGDEAREHAYLRGYHHNTRQTRAYRVIKEMYFEQDGSKQ